MKMRPLLTAIFVLLISFSCRKEEPQPKCVSKTTCYSKADYYLSSSEKQNVVSRDTTYVFKDSLNDTIRIKFRKSYSYTHKWTPCHCLPENVLSFEFYHSIYTFVNKNFACKYLMRAQNKPYAEFRILFGDTTEVIYKDDLSSYLGSQSSVFTKDSMDIKPNDLDSMSINGKYYYNIVNQFSNAVWPGSTVTNCYFAKKFGIVQFTYLGSVYRITD